MRRSHPARAAEARGRVPLPVLVALVALLAAAMRAPSGISMPARPSARRPRDGRPAQAICDAFDAMISDRPYSTPKSPRQALAELRRCAGRQFDPELVALFEQVMTERALLPTAHSAG